MTTDGQLILDGGKLEGELLQGTYYVEQKIGKGGMAWVYKASHIETGTPFALKILFSQLSANANIRSRFLREASILQQIRHPHIVGMRGVLETNGLLGMVLEWCDGGDLKDWTGHFRPPLSLGQLQSIVVPTIDAIAHAHEHGYVHRDLKLQNILMQRIGETSCHPKVADFGVAKAVGSSGATQTGAMMGTLEFMAPEQLRDAKRIDHRADIYSLGVMIYHLCTGLYPFNGSQHQLILQILSYEAPHPEGAPAVLVPLIMKCLSKDPESRFSDCRALREAWDAAVGHMTPEALPVVPGMSLGSSSDGPSTFISAQGEHAATQVAPYKPGGTSNRWLRVLLLFVMFVSIAVGAFWFWLNIL